VSRTFTCAKAGAAQNVAAATRARVFIMRPPKRSVRLL
jgi:hypothetical protein